MKRVCYVLLIALWILPLLAADPIVLSSKMRETDPTVMDVTYIVHSTSDTVNVRALAFEDGERSFSKIIRPETFVNDLNGNPTAPNIGDNISANVAHKLAWKVSSDWATDLAKVKFEILTSDKGQLPLDIITIPATAKTPAVAASYNDQSLANLFNALLWHYADHAADLILTNGVLYCGNNFLVSGTDNYSLFAFNYCFSKMGWEALDGPILDLVRSASRKDLRYNTQKRNVYKKSELSGDLYIGDKAYCVIDVSGGTSAGVYPVMYLDSCPIAGWSDEYKTTKILLRRIEPGRMTLGDRKPVMLTKPFYVGVFEITQKQYQLVTGSNPSSYKGDMRPVEYVSWNDIRGNSSTYNWPSVTTVDSSSFIGRLQANTGLNFDLPTESQWEYACRAGTTSYYNNGVTNFINGVLLPNMEDLKQLGRFSGNQSDGLGSYSEHAVVGSYSPNVWGLYDMHGNVWEWCLDWSSSVNQVPAADFIGPSSGSYRVRRGGSWRSEKTYCTSSVRSGGFPSDAGCEYGFRLVRNLSSNE